ncbi:MAG: DinB family protein [Anaerolineae bacterium]
MDPQVFVQELAGAPAVFRALIVDLPRKALHVRPAPDQWSIRDVLCHLADEERYDFRPRLEATLRGEPWPKNHPSREVALEDYARADPIVALTDWEAERAESLAWLRGLGDIDWDTASSVPWGTMRAGELLASWAAHDTHHQRQIIRLRYYRLAQLAEPYSLAYAGDW